MVTRNSIIRQILAQRLFPRPEYLASKGYKLQHATYIQVARLARTSMVKQLENSFEFRVVGSIIEGKPSKDIDLILRPFEKIDIDFIEKTLVKIRLYGLYTLGCRIDPLLNKLSEDEVQEHFLFDQAFELVSLESPITLKSRSSKKIKRIARVLLVTQMKPSERSYYKKLPIVDGKPFLRPARLLSSFS